jgi:hypothetical protein
VGLFVGAMVDPIWFASRMQGIALVPEPLWWLMGAIVSFYFGSRYQAKGQEFQRSIAETMARTGEVGANLAALAALQAGYGQPEAEPAAAPEIAFADNPALEDWRLARSRSTFDQDQRDGDGDGSSGNTSSRTGAGDAR